MGKGGGLTAVRPLTSIPHHQDHMKQSGLSHYCQGPLLFIYLLLIYLCQGPEPRRRVLAPEVEMGVWDMYVVRGLHTLSVPLALYVCFYASDEG